MKLITGLSGTYNTIPEAPRSILWQLRNNLQENYCPAHHATAIGVKGELRKHLSHEKAKVSKVKEDNNLKETATTNSPQGTVSQKTQQSVQLLLRGVNRLLVNIITINPEFAKHIDWCSLLTTIAESLHAVSRFKHETCSVLQYAMDFQTISKESPRRITK